MLKLPHVPASYRSVGQGKEGRTNRFWTAATTACVNGEEEAIFVLVLKPFLNTKLEDITRRGDTKDIKRSLID